MDWTDTLQAGEVMRWEGRPAPRCFVFRNWRHSVFGLLLLLFSVFWEMVGLQLGEIYHSPLLTWVPVPFIAAGLWLGVGHLFLARLEWEKVFYAVTDRRVLVRRGCFRPRLITMPLAELTYFRLKPLGEELGSFRLTGGEPALTLILPCIEHPRRLTALLESALSANNRLAQQGAGAAALPSSGRD